MAKIDENETIQHCGGGVNASSNAYFRLCGLKANLTLLLRRITNTILCHHFDKSNKALCHPEFISGSQGHEMLKQFKHDIKFGHTFKKAFAFTLAETLIVMGIIGVVAALTIPNLNSSTADKEKVAKLQKVYSNLNDAYGRATAVYGPLEDWFINDTTATAQSTRFAERIQEFLKVSKDCGKTGTNCFANNYTYLRDSSAIGILDNTSNYVILADGAALKMHAAGNTKSADFWVDLDGKKGSNKNGKDLFLFEVSTEKGVIPDDMLGYDYNNTSEGCFNNGYCTKWVINFGNMDYLKTDKTGKCPNGKVLNGTTVTTCK